MTLVVDHYRTILARIENARQRAVAPAAHTRLIAVSKFHGAAAIRALLQAGHRDFGESRVQEAQGKWPALRADFPDIVLHMIGPLQTNKAREAVELFDVVHSLDRPKLLAALGEACAKAGRTPQLFVQVNTGAEDQKAGILPAEAPGFIADARAAFGEAIAGLMCIPPVDQAPAPHFAFLQKLSREAGLNNLSMGMSEDFETAIAFGATHIRVGSAIFGERPQQDVAR